MSRVALGPWESKNRFANGSQQRKQIVWETSIADAFFEIRLNEGSLSRVKGPKISTAIPLYILNEANDAKSGRREKNFNRRSALRRLRTRAAKLMDKAAAAYVHAIYISLWRRDYHPAVVTTPIRF